MDNPHDTLGKRFSAFWMGVAGFLVFLVAGLAVKLTAPDATEGDPTLDSGKLEETRLETRKVIEDAQTELLGYGVVDAEKNLVRVPDDAAVPATLAMLKESKAGKTERVIPGTDTAMAIFKKQQAEAAAAKEKAEAEKPEGEAAEKKEPATRELDPALVAEMREKGKAVYMGAGICFTCHQANGEGLANVFPPLAGSEWVLGSDERIVAAIIRGLAGPIEVKGNVYNGAMPPQPHLTDDQIADVVTYIRSEWGNEAPPVTPDQVAYAREKYSKGSGMFSAATLSAEIPEGQMLPFSDK